MLATRRMRRAARAPLVNHKAGAQGLPVREFPSADLVDQKTPDHRKRTLNRTYSEADHAHEALCPVGGGVRTVVYTRCAFALAHYGAPDLSKELATTHICDPVDDFYLQRAIRLPKEGRAELHDGRMAATPRNL